MLLESTAIVSSLTVNNSLRISKSFTEPLPPSTVKAPLAIAYDNEKPSFFSVLAKPLAQQTAQVEGEFD